MRMVNCSDSLVKAYRARISVLILWLACLGSPALAGITISPLRAVITPESSTFVVIISNPSQRLIDARVSLIDLHAAPTGYMAPTIAARKAISAAPWLVVSPVAFSLEPGARQAVVVRLRKAMPLPATERRSHLYVETAPARSNIYAISDTRTGLGLDARLGVSVPVIVRSNGAVPPPMIKFGDTELVRDQSGQIVLTTMLTTGVGKLAHSLIGAISVEHAPMQPDHRAMAPAALENIALYTDSNKRAIRIPFHRETLVPGLITLSYIGRDEFAGQVLARKVFEVGG